MIITRYLTREVLNALLLITIILLLAFLCQQVVRYLNYAALGKIPTNILFQLVSFEIPYLLALLLPLGLYLGILLAYGKLGTQNEMAILQMAGFGSRRLMRLTTWIALMVTVVVLALMLWVNPVISAKRQQIMESNEATLHLIETLIPGRFQVSADGHRVMYVEKLSRDRQQAENVFLAQGKELSNRQNSWVLVFAKQGYQTKHSSSQDQFFVTTNGYRYEGIPGQNDYAITQYGKYTVRIPIVNMHVTHQENESLPTSQLWRDYANPKRAAELQWRFSIAISTFLLAMLAIPLISFRSKPIGHLALLPAILVYIIYINLLFAARRWMEEGVISIAIGMWWVHGVVLVFIVMGLLSIKMANAYKR